MASRFITFTNSDEMADIVVDGYGFKFVEVSDEVKTSVMQEASKYEVKMEKIERYTHEEYGSYDEVIETRTYDFADMLSIKEKIWTKEQGCGEIIIVNGKFFGTLFFTGFPHYKETEDLGFVPFDYKDNRRDLSQYCSIDFSILKIAHENLPQACRKTEEDESPSGRSSTSWKTNYYLIKK